MFGLVLTSDHQLAFSHSFSHTKMWWCKKKKTDKNSRNSVKDAKGKEVTNYFKQNIPLFSIAAMHELTNTGTVVFCLSQRCAMWQPNTLSENEITRGLTLYTLTLVYIFSKLFIIHFLKCWQGEFIKQSTASLVGDHFLYADDLNALLQCLTASC